MWSIENCLDLECPSLSFIENDDVVVHYCAVRRVLADAFGKFPIPSCDVYWFIDGL
jgi:hypothetical protein